MSVNLMHLLGPISIDKGVWAKDENGYTFEEMKETMYAKSSVNVRDLPNTDGKKVGKLSMNQEVTVTGKCVETGWYRLELDEKAVYVSDSYIVPEKVPTGTTGSSQNAANTKGSGSSAGNKGTGTTGNSGSSGSTEGAGSQSTQSSTSSGQSSEFVDYLNAQRAAAGLQQVSWDSSLASRAASRAVAISTNFDHNASVTDVQENILGNPSSSVSAWYD